MEAHKKREEQKQAFENLGKPKSIAKHGSRSKGAKARH